MKGHPLDLRGKRFNRLTAIEISHRGKNRSVYWKCKCDCGNITTPQAGGIRNGTIISCGCYQREMAKKLGLKAKTHGKTRTKVYHCWVDIWQRCTNKRRREYSYYGGRGIRVCKKWDKFEEFYKDMGDPPSNFSIERIDTNGNYEPSNCKWASLEEQARNRRSTKRIKYMGQTMCLTDWAKKLNKPFTALYHRLYEMNWPLEKAFTQPLKT